MTLYDILEVSPNASKEVIEKAYRVLVKKYHPDFQKPEKKAWAEEIMKKLNNAYEILSDDEERAVYDRQMKLARDTEKSQEKESGSDDPIVQAFINWYRNGGK